MANPNDKIYISDVVESEKNSPSYGDAQVLIASDKEKVVDYEKTGNQSVNYYKK